MHVHPRSHNFTLTTYSEIFNKRFQFFLGNGTQFYVVYWIFPEICKISRPNYRSIIDFSFYFQTGGSIKYSADRCGYTDIIEKTGAVILTGACPSTRGYPEGVWTAAYDSAKQCMPAAQETRAKLLLDLALNVWKARSAGTGRAGNCSHRKTKTGAFTEGPRLGELPQVQPWSAGKPSPAETPCRSVTATKF